MREILATCNRTGKPVLYYLEEQVNEWDEYYDVVYTDESPVPIALILKIGVESMTRTRFLIHPAGKSLRQHLFDSEEAALSTL